VRISNPKNEQKERPQTQTEIHPLSDRSNRYTFGKINHDNKVKSLSATREALFE